jgi:hypothetical protein
VKSASKPIHVVVERRLEEGFEIHVVKAGQAEDA